ncbi:flagellin hook IN motif-containing protein [Desulfobacterota bacterium M19]
MRTTLNTIYAGIQNNLDRITTSMADINEQISSGSQLSRLSDNPVNLVSALRFRTTVAELKQFKGNITSGSNIIGASETAMTQMKSLALRAKTLAIQAVDPALSTDNRKALAAEVKNLFEQAVQLANTEENGKFIFGGERTNGYTAQEPAPFIKDKGDGYWINGNGHDMSGLTSTVLNTAPVDLAANDLLINGTDVGAVTLTPAGGSGLNMQGAANLQTAIDGKIFGGTTMSSKLTTLVTATAATTDATADGTISFDLNNRHISVTVTNGTTAAAINNAIVSAVEAEKDVTGVTAEIGDGTNGAAADVLILKNVEAGDENAINIANFSAGTTGSAINLANGSQAADATHNTGQITLSGDSSFSMTTSPNPPDDSILKQLGLDGGGKGDYDAAADGKLVYGYPLSSGDLRVNGILVPATTADGLSDIYAASSAAAKAAAINSLTTQTGVTARVDPAHVTAGGAVNSGTEETMLTGTVTNNTINANDLAINGTVLNNAINSGAVTNGLNMAKAFNAGTQINAISDTTGVKGLLTTLYAGSAATAPGPQALDFTLNGVSVALTTGGVSPAATASDIVSAINKLTTQTGVTARVGSGDNGGALNSVVLVNTESGDESNIDVAGLSAGETTLSGLSNVNQAVDNSHNTGEISLASDAAFTVTSPTTSPPADTIIQELGLSSQNGDGQIDYGSTPRFLDTGDLRINGVDIFTIPAKVSGKDATNVLLEAINSKTAATGVKGTRGADGSLQLTAVDGRNIHIQTSVHGEDITRLNGGVEHRNRVYSGILQLRSDRKFILETVEPTVNSTEPGLDALGMAGGTSVSGEPDDTKGDGRIDVFSIHDREGSVRYAGDRTGSLNIKIGKTNTMLVGDNGKTGIVDTTLFTTLKSLENSLENKNFTTVTGIHAAASTSQLLNSKVTGLEPASQLPSEDLFSAGTFKVTVTDHDYYPPRSVPMVISVDPATDSLDSVTSRIDGIAHVSADWNSDGKLVISSDDPERYTIALNDDSSNFLKATGTAPEFMQQQALGQDMDKIDSLMSKLTEQISNFGARANRINIQTQIYTDMEVSTKGNLSEVQDTDMIKAVMELKTKETAYQAALAAASKTMQLSLVDFLK